MAFLFKYIMMKKVCFNGCSFTVGEGFDQDQRDQYIYDRLVSFECGFERTNIAKGGSSNYEIFMRSAQALKQDFDILFVQWSALNRIWLYPGPDCEWFINSGNKEFRYRSIHLNEKDQNRFRDILLMMNHDYHGIMSLIDYCDILNQLALHKNKQIVFINGLVPWSDDLINPLGDNLYESLSEYSRQILDFDSRDDDQIRCLFQSLQHKFAELDQSRWVNIFESFKTLTIDIGTQGHHPGIKSHEIMAQKIVNYLVQNALV